MSLLWLNGTLINKADAAVSPFDHGFLYGDGMWEPFRLFGGTPADFARHHSILSTAASAIGIEIPLSGEELAAAIEALAKANSRTEGYGRVVVTRGPGTIGPDPRKLDPQVIITAEEYQPFPHELYGHGLHAVVAPLAIDPDNPAHRFRTLNQLHTVQAKRHALQGGCLEAILQSRSGEVAGTTEGVLFTVREGRVARASGQPEDATADAVTALAADLELGEGEAAAKSADLFAAEEVFIAGTACGVIGLVRVDGRDIADGIEGPVTRRIREQFEQRRRGDRK